MKFFKIILSLIFILLVSFFVIHFFAPKKTVSRGPATSNQRVLVSPVKKAVMIPKKIVPDKFKGPRIAIILDDWGKNHQLLQKAIEINRPLTLAVIPNLTYSRRIAEEAHRHGLGVMLHLPMEPYNHNMPLEPHTITTQMPQEQILEYLSEAIASIPHVEGVNNHMGSAATSDERVMSIILSHLRAKKLFFVDSFVVNTSQSKVIAKKLGVLFARRDVFIDNENNIVAIRKQLEKAQRIALAHGEAIVIGHDRKLTLQAIQDFLPSLDQAGVKLVFARDLVRQ